MPSIVVDANGFIKDKEMEESVSIRRRRPVPADSADNGAAAKRPKLPATRGPVFLSFHLDMLQAMYDNNDDEDDDMEEYKRDDGKDDQQQLNVFDLTADDAKSPRVEEKIWGLTKLFLQMRNKLQKETDMTDYLKGIHEESLRYVEKQVPLDNNNRSPASQSQYQSPHHPAFRRGGSWQPLPSPARSMAFESIASKLPPTSNSCFLLTHMLERRYKIVETNTRQERKPFRSLVTFVRNKLKTLERIRATQKQVLTEMDRDTIADLVDTGNPRSVGNTEPQCSKIVKIETKIRLWRMLQHELLKAFPEEE